MHTISIAHIVTVPIVCSPVCSFYIMLEVLLLLKYKYLQVKIL